MHPRATTLLRATELGWNLVEVLSDQVGERVAGTPGEVEARHRITDSFASIDLSVDVWNFRFVGWKSTSPPTLECWLPDGTSRSIQAAPLGYTASTPPAGVTGELKVDGVYELVPGLIEWQRFRVESPNGDRAYIAKVPAGPSRTFARPERQLIVTPPSVVVGADDFAEIEELLTEGKRVTARLQNQGDYIPNQASANLIVELPGQDRDDVVIVSGHYDSVPGTPGAGDNASGVGGCLALAYLYRDRPLPRTLRFVFWGAHELGLLGSQAYVLELAQQGDLSKVSAAIALDILSDGDHLGIWTGGPQLSSVIPSLIRNTSEAYPIEQFERVRGETDSWSFAERGIDTVMLLTVPYPHFHLASDSPANNDPDLFAYSVEAAHQILDHLLER